MILNCIIVGLGGFLGATSRYLIGEIPFKPQNGFPIWTLIINISGAFLIGLITALAEKHDGGNEKLIMFLKIELCGGFTTFSTFSLDTVKLFQCGKTGLGIIYIILSVALCMGAILGAQITIRKAL